MDADRAKRLREPFPPSAIGKLPKAGMMLDYVGHAATTDRLLEVDPDWSWEPFALDDAGLPALDSDGNLWIRLTICGVTRPGVGDGKTAKERIGDAIRNAAMRFGVALDLWAKEDLSANGQSADSHASVMERQKQRIQARQEAPRPEPPAEEPPQEDDEKRTPPQSVALNTLYGELTRAEAITLEQVYAAVAKVRNIDVDIMVELIDGKKLNGDLSFAKLRDSLSKTEASNLIDRLGRLADNVKANA